MDLVEFEEAAAILSRLAEITGRPFAVTLSVARDGATLIFHDEDGDAIFDDGDFVIAATRDEIGDGTFLRLFGARVQHAAIVAAFQKLERMRTMKPKPERAADERA